MINVGIDKPAFFASHELSEFQVGGNETIARSRMFLP
jgi:hypothetical protein